MMSRCGPVREALSAALDGEAGPADDAAVRAHLGSCPACAAYARELPTLARATRLAPADDVPDLRAAVLARVAAERGRPERGSRAREDRRQRRVLAGLAGTVQLVLAVPALLGAVDVHAMRDLAAAEVALGIVFLLAAWRPAWAAALATVAAVFAGAGVLASIGALFEGAALVDELSHLLPVVGAAVVWSLAERGPAAGPRPSVLAGRG